MTKDVRDTSAAQSMRAYVVLNRKGEHVAKVLAHYSGGGVCMVSVYQHGAALLRTVAALGYGAPDEEPDGDGKVDVGHGKRKYPHDVAGVQTSRAGGGGYDKFTAALSGMVIDGHKMTDHCGARMPPPKGRLWQDSDRDRLRRKGYTLANWSGARAPGGPVEYGRKDVPADASGWVDAYRLEGLNYLSAIGYRVIQVL